MRKAAAVVSFVLVLALGAACASTGGQRISGDTISGDRLAEGPWSNVYEALSHHSALEVVREGGSDGFVLATRGGENPGLGRRTMLVSIDGVQIESGTGSMLRGIQVDQVETIRILRPAEAGARYGARGGNGVIVVETRN